MKELTQLLDSDWKWGALVEFHTRYKLVLLSHSEPLYRELGRLVAGARGKRKLAVGREYGAKFRIGLSRPATRKSHTNVMHHALGFMKHQLDAKAKRSVLQAIDDYRAGICTLSVPRGLLRSLVVRHEIRYLLSQKYFELHSEESPE